MTAASRKVWEQIATAFHPVLPPQPITKCDCEECLDVRANLDYLRWDDILPIVLEKHFGSLPLLTDEGFQALLPGFLFRALEDISSENKVLEWTLYALCGSYAQDEVGTQATNAERQKRIARLTGPQRESVRAFLELMKTAPKLDFHRDAITHALVAIWR
jgi:hypothetical protein